MEDYVITPAELRDWLSDATPGPVTVLIDACGSGAAVYSQDTGEEEIGGADPDFSSQDAAAYGANAAEQPDRNPDNFTRAFVNAFSSHSFFDEIKSGELRDPEKFSVLTACGYNEISMGTYLTEELVETNIALVQAISEILDSDDFEISYKGGAFTYALIQSIGLQYPTCVPDPSMSADSNHDGMLTLSETYINVSHILQDIDG